MDSSEDSITLCRKRKLSEDDEESEEVAAKKHVSSQETVIDAFRKADPIEGDSNVQDGLNVENLDRSSEPVNEGKDIVESAGSAAEPTKENIETSIAEDTNDLPSASSGAPESIDAGVYNGGPSLLDLPDESLLHILAFCKPREIKALGFSCIRLQEVCRSRCALWTHVDLTDIPCGRRRLATYIRGQYLHKGTLSLAVRGYSDSARGCQGRIKEKPEPETSNMPSVTNQFVSYNDQGFAIMDMAALPDFVRMTRPEIERSRRRNWRTESPSREPPKLARLRGSPIMRDDSSGCSGPRWTLHGCLLTSLTKLCPQLTELRIEYCNLDCELVRITDFPPTLKKLSLKGTRCYDTPLSQTYLFKIHTTLIGLESVDVSHCTWLSASYLLSLSKMPNLKELIARSCYRLGECVAYSSLATRYGFKALEILDIRETPMGDSEVASLGFLPRLRELYLQAPPAPPKFKPEERAPESAYYDMPKHTHKSDEVLEDESDIEDWELPDLMSDENCDELLSKKTNKSEKIEHDSTSCKLNLTSSLPWRQSCPASEINNRGANRLNNPDGTPEGARLGPSRNNRTEQEQPGPSNAREGGENPPHQYIMQPHNEGPSAAGLWQISGRVRREPPEGDNESPVRSVEFVAEQVPWVRNFRDNITLELSQAGPVWRPGPLNNQPPPAPAEPDDNPNQNEENRDRNQENPDRNQEIPDQNRVNVDQNQDNPDHNQENPNQNPDRNQDNRIPERHRFPFANVHVVACMGADSFPIHRQDITDPQHLVSDYALLRLGRSQNTDVFHIGPDGVVVISASGGNIPGSRPDKSTLEKLVCVGFSRVTDRAMRHLAVSAPRLTYIDVRNTSVTEAGVAAVPHATVII